METHRVLVANIPIPLQAWAAEVNKATKVILASFCAFFVLTNFDIFCCRFRCSYRFPHIFVDQESVCEMQDCVEAIIGEAVSSSTFGAYITRAHRPRQPRRRFNDEAQAKWFRYHKF